MPSMANADTWLEFYGGLLGAAVGGIIALWGIEYTIKSTVMNVKPNIKSMETIIPFALLCFTSFFTLTNPLGTMPVFLTMTNGLSDDERKRIIKRATITSFLILIA